MCVHKKSNNFTVSDISSIALMISADEGIPEMKVTSSLDLKI